MAQEGVCATGCVVIYLTLQHKPPQCHQAHVSLYPFMSYQHVCTTDLERFIRILIRLSCTYISTSNLLFTVNVHYELQYEMFVCYIYCFVKSKFKQVLYWDKCLVHKVQRSNLRLTWGGGITLLSNLEINDVVVEQWIPRALPAEIDFSKSITINSIPLGTSFPLSHFHHKIRL